jgi:23S rRNA pseudouridine1911/1915/1917 synthase
LSAWTFIIPLRFKGERVDFVLAQMLPKLSRSKISTLIKTKQATIKGKAFKAKDRVAGGEIINLEYQEQNTTNWVASDIKLDIVFEDDDIIVINKPAGLITHPGSGNPEGTLANALLNHNPELSKVDRVGIVHRLDKDTSGLLVVAKNNISQQHLIKQLQQRTVKREYNAICYGHLIAGGIIDEPIGRDSRVRTKQAVSESGKEAITHFRIIQKFNDFTLVKLLLETGRTHQIRVHMSHIGYPLVGDSTYGRGLSLPKGASDELKDVLKNFTRQALHAKKLEFVHPTTNNLVHFKAELPDDMQQLLLTIKQNNEIIVM